MKRTAILRVFSALLALAVMLLCCGAGALAEAGGSGEKLATVMVYLCGTDLESMNGQATKAISEIAASRFNADAVNVVLLLGGSTRWSTGYSADELTVLEIGARRPRTVDTFELASMGDPDTLSHFLTYCREQYPAQHYDLVIWDHGGGPIYGVCQDRIFGDMMDLNEIAKALDDSPFADKGLDMIVFDACLMGSAEVAARLAPYTTYMVGSEDSIYGMAYSWLTDLDKDADPLETAKRLVDVSFESNGATIQRQNATEINAMSVIQTDRMAAVVEAMDGFFDSVTADLDEANFTTMSNMRRDTMAFGQGSSGDVSALDLIDLGDIAFHYQDMDSEGAQALTAAIDSAVVYKQVSKDSCCGLTVYHPYLNKDEMEPRVAVYNDMDFSQGYTAYIQNFSAILTGTPLADWVNLTTGTPAAVRDRRTLFALALTEEQAAHFGEASLDVLLKQEDGWRFTYATPDAALDEAGQLTGEFSGTALYAVDDGGNALTPELAYLRTADGGWLIPARLIAHGEDGDVEHEARIECALDDASKELIPGGVTVKDALTGCYTTAYATTLADYDEIAFDVVTRAETRDENGTLRAFDEWEVVSDEEYRFAIGDGLSLRLLNDTLDTTTLYAAFQVTDSQNNVYTSEPLVVKAEISGAAETRVSYDDAGLVRIDGFNCTKTPEGGLNLSAQVVNLSDTEAIIALENLRVNGAETGAKAEAYGMGENWGLLKDETQPMFVQVGADALPEGDLTGLTFDLTLIDAASNEPVGTVPVEVTLLIEAD